MFKTFLTVLGVAAVVVAMAIGGGIGKHVGREASKALTSSKPTQAETEALMMEAFRETAEKINAGLPMMVDEETRLDKATVGPGPRMVYHNTFVNYNSNEIEKDWINYSLKTHVRQSVCISAEMKPSLQYGAIYSYSYYGIDGALIGDFEVNRSDCGF